MTVTFIATARLGVVRTPSRIWPENEPPSLYRKRNRTRLAGLSRIAGYKRAKFTLYR
jgi:hypothetical protein